MDVNVIAGNSLCGQHLRPLREVSLDEANDVAMVSSENHVVSLDAVARRYAKCCGYEPFCSSDALLFGKTKKGRLADADGNVFAVVEFKNGKMTFYSFSSNIFLAS